jgi:hypothetical protein
MRPTRSHATPLRVRSLAALCSCLLATVSTGLCGPLPADTDTDADGIPNSSDADIDNDRLSNATDLNVDGGIARSGPLAGTYVGDRFRNGDPRELDIDGDGFADRDAAETDIDGDGLADDDPREKDIDGDGKPDGSRTERDIDGDGFDDDSALEKDIDGDGLDDDDSAEEDLDGDGLADHDPEEEDIDGDGREDHSLRETDIDGDGLDDDSPDEKDIDGDGLDDDALEEEDIDGDGLDDDSPFETDIDGDGINNEWDPDADGDGIEDTEELSATGFWEDFDDASRWPDGATIDHAASSPLVGIPWRIAIAGGPRPTIVHAHGGLTPQNGNTLFYVGGSANSSGGKMTLAFEATAIATDALPTANQDLGCNVSFLNFPGMIADNGGIDPTGVVHTSFNGYGTTGPSIFQGESFTCLTCEPVGGLYYWNSRRTPFTTNKRQTIVFQVSGDYLTITAIGLGSLVFHHPDLSTKLAADKTHFWWEPSGTVAPGYLEFQRKLVLHRVTDNPDWIRSSSVTPGLGPPPAASP